LRSKREEVRGKYWYKSDDFSIRIAIISEIILIFAHEIASERTLKT